MCVLSDLELAWQLSTAAASRLGRRSATGLRVCALLRGMPPMIAVHTHSICSGLDLHWGFVVVGWRQSVAEAAAEIGVAQPAVEQRRTHRREGVGQRHTGKDPDAENVRELEERFGAVSAEMLLSPPPPQRAVPRQSPQRYVTDGVSQAAADGWRCCRERSPALRVVRFAASLLLCQDGHEVSLKYLGQDGAANY